MGTWLFASCRVKLSHCRQRPGTTSQDTDGPSVQGSRVASPFITYYCRLTPNCWVGRGGRGGGVLVGGGSWPLCRFCSFSSYLWTQQEKCHLTRGQPFGHASHLQVLHVGQALVDINGKHISSVPCLSLDILAGVLHLQREVKCSESDQAQEPCWNTWHRPEAKQGSSSVEILFSGLPQTLSEASRRS